MEKGDWTSARRMGVTASLALLASLFLAPGPAPAADPDWPFPDELRSRLVFVHPLVNYAVNPIWQRDWERSLAARNGIQATSGSVSTDDLYTDLVVNVTEPLGDRFRFLFRLVWREGLHLDPERQEHWLGFEGRLTGGLGAFLQVNPTPDKEELDLMAGLVLVDRTRQRYLRLGVRWDDLLYERKNDQGGTSEGEPVGVTWEARYAAGRWELFTTGRYGSASRRAYPDSVLSPDLTSAYRQDGASTLRLRHVWSDLDFAGIEASHYRFEAEDLGRDAADNLKYGNEYVHLRGLGVVRIGGPWGLRPEIHWLRQWATGEGRRDFSHRREDLFPALFAELRAPGRSTWELGYLATHHQWSYTMGPWTDDRDGYTDKIKLGWTYAFRPDARLQLSLSHELDLDRFGGGNVQYQMNF